MTKYDPMLEKIFNERVDDFDQYLESIDESDASNYDLDDLNLEPTESESDEIDPELSEEQMRNHLGSALRLQMRPKEQL